MPKQPALGVELAWLAVLALLWGSSYLFIKLALSSLAPVTLIAIRVVVAAIVLSAVMAVRRERVPRHGRTWRMLLVQALMFSVGAWTILAWGQQYIDSSLASVMNSTTPIFVFFMTLLISRHEALTAVKLFGACLGLAGVVLIVGTDALRGFGEEVFGQVAVLISSLLYAVAAIYGKRFKTLPPLTVAWGMMIWASLCLVPMSLLLEHPWTQRPTLSSLLAALTLGVFCTGLALLIYFRLIRTLGSMGVASQSYLRVGVGVLLGTVVLDEQITAVVALGVAAAILGVAAINLPARSSASKLKPIE